MASADYAITFACYNQVAYTKACVESMVRHGVDLGRVVAVDNGSGDETPDYLSSLPLGGPFSAVGWDVSEAPWWRSSGLPFTRFWSTLGQAWCALR